MTDTYTALKGPEQMTDIPEWALERVLKLVETETGSSSGVALQVRFAAPFVLLRNAFARYIAGHEKPPVNPLLIEAREICMGIKGINTDYLSGNYDHHAVIAATLAALCRGIEIGKEGAA
jgi:hypothetical protein